MPGCQYLGSGLADRLLGRDAGDPLHGWIDVHDAPQRVQYHHAIAHHFDQRGARHRREVEQSVTKDGPAIDEAGCREAEGHIIV